MINFRRLHEKCFEVTSHYAGVYGILEHATVAQGSIYSRDHLCLCKENFFKGFPVHREKGTVLSDWDMEKVSKLRLGSKTKLLYSLRKSQLCKSDSKALYDYGSV